MKIVSAAEMREIDRITTEKYGVSSLTLMEKAGSAVADFVLGEYPQAERIVAVCGKGNNGGDGFVAARKLYEAGKKVQVLLLADPTEVKGDAATMLTRLPMSPVLMRSEDQLEPRLFQADLLLDAILGTGFKPPVRGVYQLAIQRLRTADTPVVAVDIPSGVDSDANELSVEAAPADAVVTFTAPKPAHGFAPLTRGPIWVARIGSPEEAVQSSLGLEVVTARDISIVSTPRPADAHKGSFGHALIFGGSLGKSGAAAMAGMATLVVGAGLSTVATPRSALAGVAAFAPELMTEPLDETEAGTASGAALTGLLALLKDKTVVAVGPGLSRHSATVWAVREFVRKCELPVVLDADGLNAFEGATQDLDGSRRPLVLTPHPGEMARLTGLKTAEIQQRRVEIAREFARRHNAIVVLKGHRTVIADPSGKTWINVTGNPGMAKGGTGDVLTGMISGLIAQQPSRITEAVLAAVYLHGLAGDIAVEQTGERSLLATNLLAAIPAAFRWVREHAADEAVILSLRKSPF
jgi:hydroxyethylthiazole kinase-like uncharacterized protein yjeF